MSDPALGAIDEFIAAQHVNAQPVDVVERVEEQGNEIAGSREGVVLIV